MPNSQNGPLLARSGSPYGPGFPWANPQNVTHDDGINFATTNIPSLFASTFLAGTNYGFTVPSNATVLGVQFWLKRFSQFSVLVRDSVTLFKAGGTVAAATNHGQFANSYFWPIQLRQASYGGQSDTWGITLTPAYVNASDFGVAISVVNDGAVASNFSVTAMHGAVYYQTPSVTGGSGGVIPAGPSNGGVTAYQRIALFPVTTGFYAFDPGNWLGLLPGETPAPSAAGFNDQVDGSSYSYRVEEIAVGRKPTVSRLFVTYIDRGQISVTFTLTACQDNQTVVTNSATVVLGNLVPTFALLTKEVDLLLSGMNMQLSWSRAAGSGELAIAKIKMIGNVEMESYT